MVVWKTDKVKLYNDKEQEVEIHFLGGRQRDLLMTKFITTVEVDASTKDRSAKFSPKPYDLKAHIMENFVKGVNIDEVCTEDYERIFTTYFEQSFPEVWGEGDLKNLEKTSEQA